MWSFKRSPNTAFGGALAALILLSACTVQPLYADRTKTSAAAVDGTTRDLLASTSVKPVNDRVSQQVRNELLFAMNGGRLQPDGQYSIRLSVENTVSQLSVETDSLTATSARVTLKSSYAISKVGSGKIVSQGVRTVFASYDQTSQIFANERSQRDAENRAAREVAQQIRLAVAQYFAKL